MAIGTMMGTGVAEAGMVAGETIAGMGVAGTGVEVVVEGAEKADAAAAARGTSRPT